MARIVFISPYLKGGQNAAMLAHRTRYFATRPGVELLADERGLLPVTKKQQEFIARLLKSFPTSKELIEYEDYLTQPTRGSAAMFIQQVWEDYVAVMEQKENFIDYVAHRPGVQLDGEHGLWDAGGKVRNLSRAVREVSEYTGNVWTPVVALRREDAERLGYDNAKSWRALVNASVLDIAAAYKIQPDHLRWYAAFHQKPRQVHIHMVIFSTDPKEGYLSKEGIRQVKSAFARRIYHADRMHIYQQKDRARELLQKEARGTMTEQVDLLAQGDIQNSKLEQLVTELADRLKTTTGRKVYGYLSPRTKAVVDAIVEELAKDGQVSAAYDAWQNLYEQVCLDYNEQLPKRLPLSQRKEFKAVRNMVIQETLRWLEMRQKNVDAEKEIMETYEESEMRKADREIVEKVFAEKSDRVPPESSESEAKGAEPQQEEMTIKQPQPDEQVGAESFSRQVYPVMPVGMAVVRMLHHMSRIFEDNSKLDQIHRGIQIDRKRRQELQRKRLAMGHKADDHEELKMG